MEKCEASCLSITFKVDFSSSNEEYSGMQGVIIDRVSSGERLQLSEAESIVIRSGRELSRKVLQDVINGLGHGDVGSVLQMIGGCSLNRKRLRKRVIKTLLGEVEIERFGYFTEEVDSQYPLDAYLNLSASSFSHKLRRRIAIEATRGSFSEASDALFETDEVRVHKRQIEEIVISVSCDFDGYYEQRSDPEATLIAKHLPILVLSLDSKGIVMRKEDLTEETRKAAETVKKRLKHRLTTGEKLNRKRMATAAAVYAIDEFKRTTEEVVSELDRVRIEKENRRPKPVFKRVWARIEATSETVTDAVFAEALKRDKNLQKMWVVLVDGEKHQIRRIKKRIKSINRKCIIILDIIHVIEYLWRTARVFYSKDHQQCERWVKGKLIEILNGKPGYAAAGIRRSATHRKIKGDSRVEIDKSACYILNNKKYMCYDKYLKKGLPIATGVIEGVCRHVIKDRMDVTGARWSMKGAEAILKLRSIRSSNDFESYWKFHENQEFYRNYGQLKLIFKQNLAL